MGFKNCGLLVPLISILSSAVNWPHHDSVACTNTGLLLLSCVYLQIYVYSRRKLEFHQRVDRAFRRIDDI